MVVLSPSRQMREQCLDYTSSASFQILPISPFIYHPTYHMTLYSLDTQLTPWSWVLLEKPPVAQLLKNFPTFYGTPRFIIVFTRALHWSLPWARSIQSIPPYPISLRSILILSSHLRLNLPRGLFPPDFPTKILLPMRATCPAHLIVLDLIILIILGEQYVLLKASLNNPWY
jgi:hypothetical protein